MFRPLAPPSALRASRYLVGVAVLCLGAGLSIRSGLGAGPYDAVLVTLSEKLDASYWVTAWAAQALFVLAILRLRARLRLTHLIHSLLFGPVISVSLVLIPPATQAVSQVAYLVGSLSMISAGLWLYLGAAWMSGLGDELFDTVSERFSLRPTQVRTAFDVFCVALAWMGNGPVGVGTVCLALGVGPLLAVLSGASFALPESFRGLRLAYALRFLRLRTPTPPDPALTRHNTASFASDTHTRAISPLAFPLR